MADDKSKQDAKAEEEARLAEMKKMIAGTKLFGIIEGYKEERKMKLIEND